MLINVKNLARVRRWGTLLLAGATIATAMAVAPLPTHTVVRAATPARVIAAASAGESATAARWRPGRHDVDGPMIHSFWVAAEVTEVTTDTVELELRGRHPGGFMDQVRWVVTLAVDESSILLDGDLNPVDLANVPVGETAVIVPRLRWGNLGVRLLYLGDPDDLADATYVGRLVSEDENTLTLDSRDEELTVTVDENTLWVDDSQTGRPAELPEETTLRILGVEQDDDTIRAVLITPGMRGF